MFRRFLILAFAIFGSSIGALAQQSDRTSDAIKAMDREWIVESYFSNDLKDFDRIVAADFLFTAGNGKSQNKAERHAAVARDHTDPAVRTAPDYVFRIDPDSHKARLFGKTAISTGYVMEDYIWKTQHIKNRVYFTSVYLKRNGKWQVVAAQFTNVKQN